MDIIFSDEFKKEYKKIKDKETRLRIIKQVKKLSEQPQAGRPLRNKLKNHRSIRIPPFRIIYRLEQDSIVINCFDHRDDAYKHKDK
jgi:addiction module RelE/StbE family toxin